ncbi:MAG TPA: hypothetical protein VFU37_03655 [Pyrinomonadaceae bacterium]|nr:hypothetical protein [Pyrinomonadaceae bacterium]
MVVRHVTGPRWSRLKLQISLGVSVVNFFKGVSSQNFSPSRQRVGHSCHGRCAEEQQQSDVDAVNALAAAAGAYALSHSGAAPPGYFVIGDGPIIGPKQ